VDDKGIHDTRCNHPSDQENQTQEISNSPHDPESSAQPIQTFVEAPPDAPERPDSSLNGGVKKSQRIAVTRKDKNRLHATRHGVLSRYPLGALAHLGENIRSLRRIERKFRAELQPSGTIGEMLFDRFFSSYLRCLLAAKAEAATFEPIDQHAGEPRHFMSLKEGDLPTLVLQDSSGTNEVRLPADLLRQLALAARYDAHFSKEMYRALALLLIHRNSGEAALDQCVGKILGINRES
jgi:hypothetical protein